MSDESNTPAKKLAFTTAFDAYGDQFYGYFCRRTPDVHTAEDLAQVFWVSVWSRIPPAKMSEVRLLQQRANEVFADYIRHDRSRAFVEFTDHVPETAAKVGYEAGTDEEERACQERFWALVPDVKLTAQQKEAFWLHKRFGYTIAEVSDKMQVPVSTVHEWKDRAVAECQRSLDRNS